MGSYFQAVWRCRYFWLSLVKMDLRSRYRRSVLGLGWSLLHPLAMTAILCTVFHHLFRMDPTDYGPYLLAGLAFWNYLLTVTLHGCQCYFLAEVYIRQYPVPLAVYPLRVTLGAMFHFLVTLGVVLALAWYFRGLPNPAALLSLVPSVAVFFALGWAVAVLAGLATVFFRDVQQLSEVGFQILFYTTPILYTTQTLYDNGLGWLVACNPLIAFLNLIREPILDGRVPAAGTYAVALLATSAAAVVAGLALARLQRTLIFHL